MKKAYQFLTILPVFSPILKAFTADSLVQHNGNLILITKLPSAR